MLLFRRDLQETWTPIFKRTATFQVPATKSVRCRRINFRLCLARAITTHKSQGATFDSVVFDYTRSLQQQLVYVALSRVRSIEGLFITNPDNYFNFYHAKPLVSPGLQKLRDELGRLNNHQLKTHYHRAISRLESSQEVILNFNVQSLAAHFDDILSDLVLLKAKVSCFTETRNENEQRISRPGLSLLSQNERTLKRSCGVAIHEKNELTTYPDSPQPRQPLLADNDCGDICISQIVIHKSRSNVRPNRTVLREA